MIELNDIQKQKLEIIRERIECGAMRDIFNPNIDPDCLAIAQYMEENGESIYPKLIIA